MKTNQRQSRTGASAFTAALLFLFTVSLLDAADWPEWRGNQKRTAYYADPAGLPDLKPLWTASLGCSFVSSPAVVGSILYIGARDSCIHAIDIRNGRELWKKHTGGWVDASPLVFKGMVIVGSRDGTVYVLNALTGTQLSEFKAGMQLSSAALTAEGTVLAGAGPPLNGLTAYSFQQGPITALAKSTGKSWFIPFNQISYSSPAVFGTRAVIGVSDGRLIGINLMTKDTAWTVRTGGGVYLSTPAIDDSTVYFAPGNTDRSVYAYDVGTGVFFWTNLGKKAALAKYTETNMISPARFRELLRLSPADREAAAKALVARGFSVPSLLLPKPLARTAAPQEQAAEFVSYGETKTSSVAVDKEHVYVIQKQLGYPVPRFTLIAVNKYNGEEAWSFSDDRASVKLGYCSSPVTTGNVVYCGWGEGRVYGLVAKTGELAWEDSLQGDVVSSPAIAGGRIYFATMDGYIYSYSLNATLPGRNFRQSTYCYPNPARDSSMIQVFVAKKARMELSIYTVTEKPIFKMSADLPAMQPSSPKFTYRWDIRKVANGVYFAIVKVRYEDGTSDKKVLKIAVLK